MTAARRRNHPGRKLPHRARRRIRGAVRRLPVSSRLRGRVESVPKGVGERCGGFRDENIRLRRPTLRRPPVQGRGGCQDERTIAESGPAPHAWRRSSAGSHHSPSGAEFPAADSRFPATVIARGYRCRARHRSRRRRGRRQRCGQGSGQHGSAGAPNAPPRRRAARGCPGPQAARGAGSRCGIR